MPTTKSICSHSLPQWRCLRVISLLSLFGVVSSSGIASTSPDTLWGFFAHRKINFEAVFLLPDPLLEVLKPKANFISEHAVDPDKRRHSVVGEAEKHYIDIDVFITNVDSMKLNFPRDWKVAVERYGEDSLRANGIGPFSLEWEYNKLVKAFQSKEPIKYLKQMAELGHYIADLHVPLHTTVNYNGQLTGQEGIHGFWESRVPELTYTSYNLLINDEIEPITDIKSRIWNVVFDSHSYVDSVLSLEQNLSDSLKEEKFEISEKNGVAVKTYSKKFSTLYFKHGGKLQEKQMKKAIVMLAQMWYTAWITAGQPKL